MGNPLHGFYFKNALVCLKKIYKNYGLSGFYGGFLLSVIFGVVYRELLFTRENLILKSKEGNKEANLIVEEKE